MYSGRERYIGLASKPETGGYREPVLHRLGGSVRRIGNESVCGISYLDYESARGGPNWVRIPPGDFIVDNGVWWRLRYHCRYPGVPGEPCLLEGPQRVRGTQSRGPVLLRISFVLYTI